VPQFLPSLPKDVQASQGGSKAKGNSKAQSFPNRRLPAVSRL
jgi:hypothetical protein